MLRLKHLLTLSLTVFFQGSVLSQGNASELVSVVLVFRHGARTIIQPYPNDPYKNESLWPVGFGQLTNQGKMEHYALGQYFRERYGTFLPADYSEKLVYVRSTDVDRTLMSVEANLAGLYPPKGKQVWDTDIPWQPIPVHTVPEREDAVLAAKKPCAKYASLYADLMRSDEIAKINEANRDLYEYLNQHSGARITDFDQMEYLYNTLTIERDTNLTLPEWTKSVFPDRMRPLADLSFALPCYTAKLARLKTGPFLYELLSYFKNVTERNGSDGYVKMKMFSAHDTTIANILQSLRIFEYHCPPYASTVMFELRRNTTGGHYVNVVYKNSTVPQNMVLKGCGFNCPFDEFTKLVSPVAMSMDDWRRECKVSLLSAITESKENLAVASLLLVLTVCLIALTAKLVYMKSKKDRTIYLRLPDDEEQV